jgi:ketosteroid isomerase-like protein
MRVVLAAVAVVSFVSGPAFAQCPEADQKKLEQFDRAWGEAAEHGDRAHLQGIYADDFAGLSATGSMSKTQIIDTAVRDSERVRASAKPAPKVVHDYYVISCTPATATITHRNIITTMVDGKGKTAYSRSVHFLEKRSDRWQVVSNAGNPLGDAAVLAYMEREWNDAELARDYAWHERNYSDDFSGISSRTGALSTKSEDIASSKKATVTSADLSEMDVRVEGDSAVVTGINHVMGTDDKGAAFDRKIRFTDTFVKRDGRWLVWATQGTAIS